MGFGNLGFGEILIVLIIVLLLFGAKRIPEIAGSMGKGIREFKRSVTEVDRSIRDTGESDFGRGSETRVADRLPAGERDAALSEEPSRPEPKRLL
jgi:sec-independent protein translocase protein TatA